MPIDYRSIGYMDNTPVPSFAMANTKASSVGYGSGSSAPGPGGSFDRAGAYGPSGGGGRTTAGSPGAGVGSARSTRPPGGQGTDAQGNVWSGGQIISYGKPQTYAATSTTARRTDPTTLRHAQPTQHRPQMYGQMPAPGYYNSARQGSWASAVPGDIRVNSKGQTVQKQANGNWAIVGRSGSTGQRRAHQGAMPSAATRNPFGTPNQSLPRAVAPPGYMTTSSSNYDPTAGRYGTPSRLPGGTTSNVRSQGSTFGTPYGMTSVNQGSGGKDQSRIGPTYSPGGPR